MIEFIDGKTPLNRSNLMGFQGFIPKTTEFRPDGSIVETNSNGETLTTTFEDGKIIETLVGEKTIKKTTAFNADGSISEVIS